jgi:hypothetical protein
MRAETAVVVDKEDEEDANKAKNIVATESFMLSSDWM